MLLNPISPQNSLNQAYRKVKPYRKDIEAFRENLLYLISQVDDAKDQQILSVVNFASRQVFSLRMT